ncbi:MAG: Thivi_2564 family membrane protein [bacterium]
MPIVNIIGILVVTGFGLWAINRFVPMARPVKTILNVVVVAVLCLWLLQTFGVIDNIKCIRVG